MLIVRKGDFDLGFRFFYDYFNYARRTCCEVLKAPAGKRFKSHGIRVSGGSALCSHEDNFCKATGRKISFARAISCYSKDERRKLWREYEAEFGF